MVEPIKKYLTYGFTVIQQSHVLMGSLLQMRLWSKKHGFLNSFQLQQLKKETQQKKIFRSKTVFSAVSAARLHYVCGKQLIKESWDPLHQNKIVKEDIWLFAIKTSSYEKHLNFKAFQKRLKPAQSFVQHESSILCLFSLRKAFQILTVRIYTWNFSQARHQMWAHVFH